MEINKESIEYIDEVRIFDEDTPLNLIMEISPDLLIKGSDYLESEIVGADFVKKYRGEILRVNIIEDRSTTKLLDKINKIFE